jgi:hypothetical protein
VIAAPPCAALKNKRGIGLSPMPRFILRSQLAGC